MIKHKKTILFFLLSIMAFMSVVSNAGDPIKKTTSTIDLEKWIEERPGLDILKPNIDKISEMLVKFNSSRTDKLRVYVCVVSDYGFALRNDVDPTMLPSRIKKLEDYITGYETTDYYERFKTEPGKIVKEIKEQLTKEGIEEQVIYFCRVGRLYDYNNDGYEHIYHWDNLSIVGGRLKEKSYAIRSMTKLAWKRDDLELTCVKIEKAVGNILNAIELVIDKGIENNEQLAAFGCRMDLAEATEKTKDVRKAKFAETVAAVAKLIDNPTSAQQLKSRYVIVDKSGNFPSDDEFFRYSMPDKIALVSEGYSNYKMYVVFAEVEFGMEPSDWEVFANEVYKKSSQTQSGNVLLMTVPYYKTSCTYTNMLGYERTFYGMLLMPGVRCSDSSLERNINSGLSIGSTWTDVLRPFEMAFNHAFSKIPKYYEVLSYSILWNGDVFFHQKKKFGPVAGLEDLVVLHLRIDERYDEYIKVLRKKKDQCGHYNDVDAESRGNKEICEAFVEAELHGVSKKEQKFKLFEEKTNLIQSKLNEETASKYVQWISVRKQGGLFGSIVAAPAGNYFYGGNNRVKDKDVLAMIDIMSTVASVVQLDFVFDAWGGYYAFTHGMKEEAAFYVVAVAIPGSVITIKAICKGEAILMRSLRGVYVSVSTRMAKGTIRGVGVENNVGDVIRAIIHEPKAFGNVVKHSSDKNFIQSLEDDLLKADDEVIEALNKNPNLVDEYRTFHKDGKGDLKTFIKNRGYKDLPFDVKKFLDDPEVVKIKGEVVDKNLQAQFPNHSVDELTAIRYYTEKSEINNQLGQGTLDEFHQGLNYFLKNGLDKGTPYTKDVYSGLGPTRSSIAKSWKVGEEVSMKGYSSCATHEVIAERFMNASNGDVILVIKDPQSMEITKISRYDVEEVLVQPNVKFNVLKIEDETFGGKIWKKITLGKQAGNADEIVNTKLAEFKASNADAYVKKMVDDAEKRGDNDALLTLLGLKEQPANTFVGPSGKTYTNTDTPCSPSKKAEDGEKQIPYLHTAEERAPYEVKVKDGKLYLDGQPFKEGSSKMYIYVLGSDGKIYARYDDMKFRHSSFLAGENVAAAGTLHIDQGLMFITNHSGHYEPKVITMERIIQELTSRGVDSKSMRLNLIQR
jgi:hypothetical protein